MRLPLVFAITVGFTSSINAQVSIKWQEANSLFISPDQIWNVTLINNGAEIQEACLKVSIKDKQNQLVYEGLTTRFTVTKGLVNITPFSVFTATSEYYNNNVKEIVSTTGRFPDNDYVICIDLIDNSNQTSLDQDCREKTSVNFSPPRLRSPENNSTVDANRLLLSWTPPKPVIPDAGIKYEIKIVEIFANQTPAEALVVNPPWFEEKEITPTSIMYPVTASPLLPNSSYAWRVKAHINGKFIGETETWSFKVFLKEQDEENSFGSFVILSKEIGGQTYETDRYLRISFQNEDATNQFTYNFFDISGNKVVPKSTEIFKTLGDNKHVIDLKKHHCFTPGEYYYVEVKTRNYEVYKLRFRYIK